MKVSASSRYLERVQHTSKLTEVVGLQESQRRRARRCQASHVSSLQLRVDRGLAVGQRAFERSTARASAARRACGPQFVARTQPIGRELLVILTYLLAHSRGTPLLYRIYTASTLQLS